MTEEFQPARISESDWDAIRGETFACMTLITSIASALLSQFPYTRPALEKAFDSASDAMTHLAMQHGGEAGQVPVALDLIEHMRAKVLPAPERRHGV